MDWLNTYHEDHKAVLILLAKFEGNIMDLKAGFSTPHTFVEFREFADVIQNVIIPHFRNEEKTVYRELAESGPEGRKFIDDMLHEHEVLYSLFDQYSAAVKNEDKAPIIEIGGKLEHVLRHHITKEEDEIPKLLNKL